VDWDDSALYDLVINTRKLSLDRGVHMILGFMDSPGVEEEGKKAEEKLLDIALLQKVEATLLGILGVEVRHINIQVEGGKVILRGAVGSAMEKGNCEKTVADIEGVREVDNQLFVTEHFRFGG
jgi:osmotically-inducible protein OsmY